jgi:hypothetical protein
MRRDVYASRWGRLQSCRIAAGSRVLENVRVSRKTGIRLFAARYR